MRRVEVEEVLAAIRRTGVIPTRCVWAAKRRAYAIGAVAIANDVKRKDIETWAISAEGLGLDEHYLVGFISGFDGGRPLKNRNEVGRVGFEDVRACAHAVFEEKLHLGYSFSTVNDLSPYLEPPPDDEQPVYVVIALT